MGSRRPKGPEDTPGEKRVSRISSRTMPGQSDHILLRGALHTVTFQQLPRHFHGDYLMPWVMVMLLWVLAEHVRCNGVMNFTAQSSLNPKP